MNTTDMAPGRTSRRTLSSMALAIFLLSACGGGDAPGSGAATGNSAAAQPAVIASFAPKGGGGSAMACATRVNNTFNKLLECTTLAGVRRHQAALQAIADANGGIRASGTPGYGASAAYAAEVFRKAGYAVTLQAFPFQTFIERSPTVLEQVAPPPAGPITNQVLAYSGSGDVSAPVSQPSVNTGCSAADFAAFPAGHIALIGRGTCAFAVKAGNASGAGAVGVVIYNNVDGVLNGTLGEDFALDIGVTGVTQATGQRLAATQGLTLRLKSDTFRGEVTTHNLIAESRAGDAGNVVMVGAHLDSVNAGPGINDNGSGSAAILETAVQMAKVRPRNKVRFALWAAEESGLVGSTHYVEGLSDAERSRIALYLNFDMIGSPNPVYFIYDGDDSDGVGEGPGPGGSAEIEKAFEAFYQMRGAPYKGTDFDGRSDYGPFIEALIPSGGLFTGAEGIKTADEAARWGGTAGQAYDPCYHQACDTYANNNDAALDLNADAVAYTTLLFAQNTSSVNGQRGKGNFKMPHIQWPALPPVRH
jgi:Zn-dependent M28 family amino/carboxypeptidase